MQGGSNGSRGAEPPEPLLTLTTGVTVVNNVSYEQEYNTIYSSSVRAYIGYTLHSL